MPFSSLLQKGQIGYQVAVGKGTRLSGNASTVFAMNTFSILAVTSDTDRHVGATFARRLVADQPVGLSVQVFERPFKDVLT